MRFGDYETLHKYEKLKDEIFNNKKQQFKDSYRKAKNQSQPKKVIARKLSIPPFIKRIAFISSLGAIGYYFITDSSSFDSGWIPKFKIFNPMRKYGFVALFNDLQYKTLKNNSVDTYEEGTYANKQLFRLFQTDLKKIQQKIQGRLISQETKSKWGIGVLRFGVYQQSLGINEDGILVRMKKSSKIKIGGLSLLGRKSQQIISQQKTSQQYSYLTKNQINQQSFKKQIRNSCEVANLYNRYYLSSEYYDLILNQCLTSNQKILNDIRKNLKKKYSKIIPVNSTDGSNSRKNGRLFIFS